MTSLKSFDADGVQFAWDATSLSAYAKCPRYYQYKHLQGWTQFNKSVHLWFGGHYAKALESYHKLRYEGASPDEATATVVLNALVDTWQHELDENGVRIPDTGEAIDYPDEVKNRFTLIRSIVWYLDQHRTDDSEVLIIDNKPAVELSFSLPLSDSILYCGHMDRVQNVAGQGNFVVDQKTSKATISARYFYQYNPDFQMSGYSWAGKIMFDIPISGVVIDAAQIAVGFTRFSRGFVHKAPQSLDEWQDNALSWIEEAQQATRSGRFKMNCTSCNDYGGCEFRKICERIPEHRMRLLESDYVQRPIWDPLEQR